MPPSLKTLLITQKSGLLPVIWVRIFYGNPRFHTMSLVWNLRLIREIPREIPRLCPVTYKFNKIKTLNEIKKLDDASRQEYSTQKHLFA